VTGRLLWPIVARQSCLRRLDPCTAYADARVVSMCGATVYGYHDAIICNEEAAQLLGKANVVTKFPDPERGLAVCRRKRLRSPLPVHRTVRFGFFDH